MRHDNLPNLMVLGHGAHGKDTVCALLPGKFEFISSSYAACESAVFPALSKKYGYTSIDECYADRRSKRVEWKNLIRDFNGDELTRLGAVIYNQCNVYNGIRRRSEFEALRADGFIDYTIYVDAHTRLPDSIDPSMDMNPADADFVLDNNGPEEKLAHVVTSVVDALLLDWQKNTGF